MNGVTKNVRHHLEGPIGGFIVGQDGQDYYWQVSDLQGVDMLGLDDDVEVTFDPVAAPDLRQPRASNVRLAARPAQGGM